MSQAQLCHMDQTGQTGTETESQGGRKQKFGKATYTPDNAPADGIVLSTPAISACKEDPAIHACHLPCVHPHARSRSGRLHAWGLGPHIPYTRQCARQHIHKGRLQNGMCPCARQAHKLTWKAAATAHQHNDGCAAQKLRHPEWQGRRHHSTITGWRNTHLPTRLFVWYTHE